jgi:DNA polymerase I-like protein with 3'-5' exonuclease and polymerase domains
MILGFDVETTTKERGHVHHPDNFLVSYSFSNGTKTGFHYYKDPDFKDVVVRTLLRCRELVGFNLKFDIQWLMRNGVEIEDHVRIYDVALAEQILTAQQSPMVSFNEVLEGYGIQQKLDVVKGYWEQGISTENIPIEILEEYNNDDAEKPLVVRAIQMGLLSEKQLGLVYQQGQDLLVLARTELNGVKFDTERAKDDHARYQTCLMETEELLRKYLPDDFPSGVSFNWDSGDQLSCLLYGGTVKYDYAISEEAVYKSGDKKGLPYTRNHWHQHTVEFPRRFDPLPKTEVKKTKDDPNATARYYQVDDPTLRQLRRKSKDGKQLLAALADKAKYSKICETFDSLFRAIERYGWQGYLHGQYNQNVARTGRLSSSKPNLQNTDATVDECLISRYD